MRSTCCQNANPTGAGAGLLYILTSSFRQETTNCQTKQLLSNLLHTKRALKAQAGENSEETQEKEEGRREEEKGNTYSMAKN